MGDIFPGFKESQMREGPSTPFAPAVSPVALIKSNRDAKMTYLCVKLSNFSQNSKHMKMIVLSIS